MLHVIVKLWPGKSEHQRRRLAQAITDEVINVPEDIDVNESRI
jgi:hypothetical protein